MIAIALGHMTFPRYFEWKEELARLSLINRQMMKVHSFFIALTVFLLGLLCLTSPTELSGTDLGRKISLGIGVFWTARLAIQLLGYSTRLWRGKSFATLVHVILTVTWIYFSMVFLWIAAGRG